MSRGSPNRSFVTTVATSSESASSYTSYTSSGSSSGSSDGENDSPHASAPYTPPGGGSGNVGTRSQSPMLNFDAWSSLVRTPEPTPKAMPNYSHMYRRLVGESGDMSSLSAHGLISRESLSPFPQNDGNAQGADAGGGHGGELWVAPLLDSPSLSASASPSAAKLDRSALLRRINASSESVMHDLELEPIIERLQRHLKGNAPALQLLCQATEVMSVHVEALRECKALKRKYWADLQMTSAGLHERTGELEASRRTVAVLKAQLRTTEAALSKLKQESAEVNHKDVDAELASLRKRCLDLETTLQLKDTYVEAVERELAEATLEGTALRDELNAARRATEQATVQTERAAATIADQARVHEEEKMQLRDMLSKAYKRKDVGGRAAAEQDAERQWQQAKEGASAVMERISRTPMSLKSNKPMEARILELEVQVQQLLGDVDVKVARLTNATHENEALESVLRTQSSTLSLLCQKAGGKDKDKGGTKESKQERRRRAKELEEKVRTLSERYSYLEKTLQSQGNASPAKKAFAVAQDAENVPPSNN